MESVDLRGGEVALLIFHLKFLTNLDEICGNLDMFFVTLMVSHKGLQEVSLVTDKIKQLSQNCSPLLPDGRKFGKITATLPRFSRRKVVKSIN